MKPLPFANPADVLKRLTQAQRAALGLLHLTQPTRQRSSGIPGSVWKALRTRHLARSGPSELEWFLTEAGKLVQDVMKGGERGSNG